MAAAEYEFGAVTDAQSRLADSRSLVICCATITMRGASRKVYFLGEFKTIEKKIAAMRRWINEGMQSKTRSNFNEHFSGVDISGAPISSLSSYRTVVWWSLGDDLVWSFDRGWLDVFTRQCGLRAVDVGTL